MSQNVWHTPVHCSKQYVPIARVKERSRELKVVVETFNNNYLKSANQYRYVNEVIN